MTGYCMCGQPLSPKKSSRGPAKVWCSATCRARHARAVKDASVRLNPHGKHECEWCGQRFDLVASGAHPAKYCSAACIKGAAHAPRKPVYFLECRYCGRTYCAGRSTSNHCRSVECKRSFDRERNTAYRAEGKVKDKTYAERIRQRATVFDPDGPYECGYCRRRFSRSSAKGKPPTYCSDLCQSGAKRVRDAVLRPLRPCEFCGSGFKPGRNSDRKQCDQCRLTPKSQRLPSDHWVRWWGAASRWAPPKSNEPPDWIADGCPECGGTLECKSGNWPRYCSRRCARRASKDRRRARKKSAYVADVRRIDIFERDGWRCHLCGRKVDRRKAAPHPMAPTIDHVIPLADGGTHEPANCATAHFRCNSLKGARGGGEQLALIG